MTGRMISPLEERDECADEQRVSGQRAQGGTDAVEVARAQLDDRGHDGIVEPIETGRLAGVSERAPHGCGIEAGHALRHREVGQRVLRGAVEVLPLALQSRLERAHVAGLEPAGDEELHPGREHAGDVHGREPVPRNETGQRQDDRGTRTPAQGVGRHVDDRLGRALGRGRQRGVEELVSGAEDGAAHRDVQPSGDDPSPQARHEEAEQAGRADDRRVARYGTLEAETTEQEAPRRGLKEESDEAGRRIEETEEAYEGLALPEVRDGFRLQEVLDERGQHGRQGNHERQIAEQRCPPDPAPPAEAIHVLTRALAGRRGASDDGRTDRADEVAQPQRQEERAFGQQRRDAFRADPAHQTAEGRRGGHARHHRLRRVRVEAFVEERPEHRYRDAGQHGRVHVQKHRHRSRLSGQEGPFRDEQDSAEPQHGRDHAGRAEPDEQCGSLPPPRERPGWPTRPRRTGGSSPGTTSGRTRRESRWPPRAAQSAPRRSGALHVSSCVATRTGWAPRSHGQAQSVTMSSGRVWPGCPASLGHR